MKKFFKVLGYIFGGLLLILLITYLVFLVKWNRTSANNMKLLGEEALNLTVDGLQFRDLNKNGRLDPYEDHRVELEQRIDDLIGQMNVEEKAGMLFITMTAFHPSGALGEVPSFKDPITFAFESNSELVVRKKMNHFNIIQSPATGMALLDWNNNLQKIAERTRLGIPVTIASDPRHGTKNNPGAGIETPFFSEWPSPLGFGATRDSALVRTFGDIARQEYGAVGIRMTLSPMADLATEPRWGRANGTFTEDAELSSLLTKAYVLGFQGDSLYQRSVACMTKHFPGGGPQKDGEDAHFYYGADQVYPGNNFDYHLVPFEGAFEANTAQIMPYYGVPVGQTEEAVAFGFNKEIITDLLREKIGYDGVVCTDWGLISDMMVKPASAWGVEALSLKERVAKVLNAGCDMFGGEALPHLVVELVKDGTISEARLDISVRRILRDKFRLGLFEQPYLEKSGLAILKNENFQAKGKEAQRKSLILLKNEGNTLPLEKGTKVYVKNLNPELAAQFTDIVDRPEEAEIIIQKLITPYDPRSEFILESFFHQGRLTYNEKEKAEIFSLMDIQPTITIMTLERPTIFPEINARSEAVIGDFYCSEEVLLELIFGQFSPTGKLPVEIPSSEAAVLGQKEDVPYDSKDPLYPYGHGLTY